MPMHEPSCIEDPPFFVVSLLCCQLVSSSLDCLPCLDARTLWLKFESPFMPWSSPCFMRTVSVASDHFDFSIHFISFLIISLIFLLFLLPDTFNFLNVADKYLRTSAEGLGTLAENKSSTGYEPNDHFSTEAYVEYSQESLGEQQFPDDSDYDDVTIGKTFLDACRRRADHSEEEGLSSCLSSSVSHDRTERPVVCRLVSSA